MARGEHFFVWRHHRGLPFQHHGIDLGDGTVVHFTDGGEGVAGPGGATDQMIIARTSEATVKRGGRDRLHFIQHTSRFTADEIAERAMSQLGRQGYHLLFDNCEHFARWCAVGDDESQQINVACERISSLGIKATAGMAVKLAGARMVRGVSPGLYLADAAQWLTEAGGHHLGLRDPNQRRKAGRVLGATTAIGAGATSGPIGIAIAGGLWMAGQFGGEISKMAYSRLRRRRNSDTTSHV